MILIADSGSTKTNWYYSDGDDHSEIFSTEGINPFFRNTEDIIKELRKELVSRIGNNIKQIYFYGAGIINQETAGIVKRVFHNLFPKAKNQIYSDLLAAARATLGNKEGIACILGTGSNSCYYDGEKITGQVPPLGFILGDEGSGAVLGRKLVGDYLKGIMPVNISDKFSQKYPFKYEDYLEKVYKKEKPNKFLAEFVPFLKDNLDNKYCATLVGNSFNEFIARNIKQYSKSSEVEICFVGSIAFYIQHELKTALDKNNLKMGKILREPLSGLVEFHLKQ